MSATSVVSPSVTQPVPAAQARRWSVAFGLYTASTNLIFTQAVWVIYLASKGYSPFAIGLFETCFHAVKFLAEVPSGVFADLVGRRASLMVSALIGAAAVLLFLVPLPPLIAVSFALQGLSYAFRGGADSALLWAIVQRAGTDSAAARYSRLFSRMFLIVLFTQTLGMAGGGFLHDLGEALPFALSAVTTLLALVPLGLLPEQRAPEHARTKPLAHFAAGARAAWEHPPLFGLLLLSGLTAGVVTTVGYYTQLYFSALGLSLAVIGLLLAATIIPDALFAAATPRIMRWLPRRWVLMLFVSAEALGILAMSTRVPALGLIGFLLLVHAGDSVLYPALSTYVNELSPEVQRATVLSLETGLFSGIMIVLFPLFGLGLTQVDYATAYLWTFVALVVGSLSIAGLVRFLQRRRATGEAR